VTVRNPWNDEVLREIAWDDASALESALEKAALAAPVMARASRHERSSWCASIAAGLEARLEEFAQCIVAEAGKPIRFARDEVRRAIATFSLAAGEALRFGGEVVPLDIGAASAGYLGYTSRVPVGPVAAITPFNFPINLVAHKVAPALAVGNPIVLKPAPATPLTSMLLAELVEAAGVPQGGFVCLNLEIPGIEALVEDPRIKFVSFTGSAKVGWQLKSRVPHKRVALELGGNAAAIVHSDANLGHCIPRLAMGGYAYAGQVCISVQRILVHRPIYQTFRERFVAEVESLGVGDPSLETTVVGPLIHAREVERMDKWVTEARDAGAHLLTGGEARPPVYLPTVLENVPPQCSVSGQEVFGPVTVLSAYDEFPEALARVNDSQYGLQVGIFTRDLERVLRSHQEAEVGAVIVNDYPTFRVDNMPYGGVKQSGFGREGVKYTMEEMTEIRLLAINTNPL